MNPKSEKPLRLFNPFSIWTDIALKSGAQPCWRRRRPR